mmetsp:Transcript_58844/g.118174  ORF Transcript_58844/g.118174 Transcript_58844/m.118174 type:complete len:461 (+) Transcript_58844:115-1497(+)
MSKCVVIDLGGTCIKVGFGGDPTPQMVAASPWRALWSFHEQVSVSQWLHILGPFLVDVYASNLMVRPRHFRLFVCEALLCPRAFRTALMYAAFETLGVPELNLCPTPVATLYATGTLTGLIVDIGADETRCLAVVDGQPLFHTLEILQSGTSSIASEVSRELSSVSTAHEAAEQVESFGEEAMLQTCYARSLRHESATSNDFQLEVTGCAGPLLGGVLVKGHTRQNAADVLFGGGGGYEGCGNVAATTLQCLSNCAIDVRRAVSGHVVLVGGGSLVPGMRQRLEQEIRTMVNDSDRHPLARCVSESLWIANSPFPGNILTWVGGSVLSSVEHSVALGISRDAFASATAEALAVVPRSPSSLQTENEAAVMQHTQNLLLPDWLALHRDQRLLPFQRTASIESVESENNRQWMQDTDGFWSKTIQKNDRESTKKQGDGTRSKQKDPQSKEMAIAGVGIVFGE